MTSVLASTGAGMGAGSIESWISLHRDLAEQALRARLSAYPGANSVLNEAISYGLLNGGKRLRALLVAASGYAVGSDWSRIADAACAIEAMHAYSLVHDDLPCMDDDVLRRGQPTCHVKFGEAMGLLAGDALQTLAFEWLSESQANSAPVTLAQVRELARASGARGMAAGQATDLQNVGLPMELQSLFAMHARKTGDLIRASIRLGYLTSPQLDASITERLEGFADTVGLAYQVIDDILDVESSSEVLGKTSGKDALQNKPTVVSLMGLEGAREFLAQLTVQSKAHLDLIPETRRAPLLQLVDLITQRQS